VEAVRKSFVVLALTWVSWFWSHGTRVGISAITPFLRQRFAITTAETAAVPGLLNLGFYTSTAFSGRVALRTGFSMATMLCALAAGLSMTIAAFSPNIVFFYAAMLLLGISLSLHLPSAIPWLGQLFKGGRQGFFIGVHESGAPAGQTLGPILLVLLLTTLSFSNALLSWAIIPLTVAALLLIYVLTERKQAITQTSQMSVKVKTLPLTVVTIANLVGNLGVVAIIPLHLVDTFHLDKAFVASIVGFSRALGILGQPIGGYLYDRYGFIKVSTILTVTNLVSNIYLMLASFTTFYPVVMTIQATATAMYFPIVYSHIVARSGQSASKVISNIFSVSGLVGPTSAPIIAGFIAERFGYVAALSYPTLLSLAGVVALYPLREAK